MTDGGWGVTDGGWGVTDGGWGVTDGGWGVTDGGWIRNASGEPEPVLLFGIPNPPICTPPGPRPRPTRTGPTQSHALCPPKTSARAVRRPQVTSLEVQMNSVSRVTEYAERLQTEPPAVIPGSRPAFGWMAAAVGVEFRAVSARHRPGTPRVLRGVSLCVEPGEKVGVVGRTGSGKSTLMLALFRLIALDQGQILIDGLDIATIGVGDLRQRLCIIPQDPTLFSGTVRQNLDPMSEHPDHRYRGGGGDGGGAGGGGGDGGGAGGGVRPRERGPSGRGRLGFVSRLGARHREDGRRLVGGGGGAGRCPLRGWQQGRDQPTAHGTVHVVPRREILVRGVGAGGWDRTGCATWALRSANRQGGGATQTHRTREPHQEGRG